MGGHSWLLSYICRVVTHQELKQSGQNDEKKSHLYRNKAWACEHLEFLFELNTRKCFFDVRFIKI